MAQANTYVYITYIYIYTWFGFEICLNMMKSNSYVKLPKDKFPHVAVDDDGYMERFTTPALTKVVHLGSPDKVTIRIAPPVNPYYPRWNPININTIPLRRSYPIWLGHIYSINYNTYIYIYIPYKTTYIYPIYISYISYIYILYVYVYIYMHHIPHASRAAWRIFRLAAKSQCFQCQRLSGRCRRPHGAFLARLGNLR